MEQIYHHSGLYDLTENHNHSLMVDRGGQIDLDIDSISTSSEICTGMILWGFFSLLQVKCIAPVHQKLDTSVKTMVLFIYLYIPNFFLS